MLKKISSYKNITFLLILFFFSIIINYHYASLGAFPMDTFFHFDTAYRILNGEHPIKDFWIVSGPAVDYIQAIFFYIFGVNWQSYLLHSSLLNAILTLATFFVLKNFNLEIKYCFIYSIFFSILAYPSSGTPFVDHHSAFFSLLGIYSLLIAIKNNKKIYWYLLPVLLYFAFLSKPVPSGYVIISVFIVLFLYSLINKTLNPVKYCSISFFVTTIIIFIFGRYCGITLSSFLEQYIFYTQSIGAERLTNVNFTFNAVIAHFKFIYLAMIPLFYINLKNLFVSKNYIKYNDFYYFLILLLFTFSLILHQLLTKNQTFIFFLIPILAAFSQINLIKIKIKLKNYINIFFILIFFAVTVKYHLRFNENRKFHELQNVNFELSVKGKKIHNKLSGLNWITTQYKDNPEDEIKLINQIQSYLIKDSRNKMVLTTYPFFSAILDQKLHSPFRVYAGDGTQHPVKGSKYYTKYKDLIIHLIKKNRITVIYIVTPLKNNNIYDYIDQSCLKETTLLKNLKSYELKDCVSITN